MITAEENLMDKYPGIEWRRPLPANLLGPNYHGLACRLCLSTRGLTPDDGASLPQTYQEFVNHMQQEHGLKAVFR